VKRKTLRYILLLAIISITGIIAIQIYWFSKAFDIREKQFSQTVHIALRNVVDQIQNYSGKIVPQVIPVEQLSSNYFVVMLNDEIDVELLQTLLINEFTKRELSVDFEYGIYDCVNEKMVFGSFVHLGTDEDLTASARDLPLWKDNDYYFGVLFPDKNSALLGQMSIWIFSSFVLLVVVVFFGYALYIIFKQRKFTETQKQFINNMTHEFRTPISTIQLSSAVLQNVDIVKDKERLNNYAKIIKEESDRLFNQVENILQAAILEDKKLKLKKEPLNVHTLLEEVVQNCSLVLKDNVIETNLKATRSIIMADKVHFFNMIKNLVENAIKYSHEIPKVRVHTEDDKRGILIEISDCGIGIPKEHHKKIFKKFYRVPTGNIHDVKGFGLGLNYVKSISKMHQGRISLESNVGVGSTFKLIFPVHHES
jgi:two-component system phosphate regulon sensor histidine kinase PhoR